MACFLGFFIDALSNHDVWHKDKLVRIVAAINVKQTRGFSI